MIIALSIIQIILLTAFSGNVLAYFNRYPMKLFANQVLSDPQSNKRIGLYQLGNNNRARMGVMTGLPTIYLKNPEELKLFIKPEGIVYIVMRQSEWEQNFHKLPVSAQVVDTGWKKSSMAKIKIQDLAMHGLGPQLDKHSESYVLLKKTETK